MKKIVYTEEQIAVVINGINHINIRGLDQANIICQIGSILCSGEEREEDNLQNEIRKADRESDRDKGTTI